MSVSLPAMVGFITENLNELSITAPPTWGNIIIPFTPLSVPVSECPIAPGHERRDKGSFVLPGALERTLTWGRCCTGVSVPLLSAVTLPEDVFWVCRLCPQEGIPLAEVLERKKQGEGWVYFWPPGVLYEANQHLQMKIKDQANSPASDNCKAGLILMKSATYIYINHNDSCLLSM